MAKKRRVAASKPAKRVAKKSAKRSRSAKRSKPNPNNTVNALVILVVIIIALAGVYFYLHKTNPAALQTNTSPPAISLQKK
jgi:cytoskeletal protein RodZ